jgi:Flp pilus assembly protein TadD
MKGIFGEYKFMTAVAVVALMTVSLTACANPLQSEDKNKGVYVFTPSTDVVVPKSRTLAGNYLAARFAQRHQDWHAAHLYMKNVIAFDTANPLLTQRAFLLAIGAGEHDSARSLATGIAAAGAENSELAFIYLACDALQDGDFNKALTMINSLPDDGFGQYTKPLLTAWTTMGKDGKEAAIAYLKTQAEETDPTFNIHAALMSELAGDTDTAEKHYRTAMSEGLTLPNAVLAGNFFQRKGDVETAQKIYSGLGNVYSFTPFVGKNTRPNIQTAADGAAVALFDLATLLYERRAYDSAQIYGRLVQLLSPQSSFAHLMMGDIAAINEHYGDAVAAYDDIADTSPLYWLSRMRVAEVYEASDHSESAAILLEELAENKATRVQALIGLGDLHRRHEHFAEAIESYDAALAEIGDVTEDHWAVVYARGMSLERLNNWDRAEKDLLQALAFQPDNPMILNYIGYSWAEKGINLHQAKEYLHRAVTLRPNDGYILDSYGWVLYRLGQFEEAAKWLEKSVAYVPDDTNILDHLGDAYWQTGRQTEARFKWQRAHDLSKDADFRNLAKQKLTRGIEAPATTVVVQEAVLSSRP